MIEIIYIAFWSIWLCGSILFTFMFAMIADLNNKTTLKALKDLTIELFDNKNWFGILLSVIICIILIPSYMLALVIEVICMFYRMLVHIWEFGEKR